MTIKILVTMAAVCTFLGCSDSSKFLKDIYSKDFYLSDMKKKDTIVDYFSDKSECDSIVRKSLIFRINHEKNKSLENIYMNIYIGQKKIFSGEYREVIVTDSLNLCVNKKSGNYIWFSAYDINNKIYYSWGQKNSVDLKDEYSVTLLQNEDDEGNNYLIKK